MFTFCPFCRSSRTKLAHVSTQTHQGWRIECHECGGSGPIVSRQSEAWKRWNGLRWARRALRIASGS